jgi:uncharacterized protein YjdB
LVIGLSFFTFYSDSAFSESWNNDTAYPFSDTLEETVYISINQVNTTETENQSTLEQAANVTTNDNPVEIHLENPTHAVKTVQMEVCDDDDYLTLTTCVTTDRTAGFLCRANESSTGCCSVRLFSMFPNVTIAEGSGPIFILNHHVSEEAPSGECRTLTTENSVVTDPGGTSLQVVASPGEYCFSAEQPSCAVAISPESDEVLSGETIEFSAQTTGTGCSDPCYTWQVTGASGAIIDDSSGRYTAGDTGGDDMVTVSDNCNDDINATADVVVLQDSDHDGIPDVEEVFCTESNSEEFVTIDECETGIKNELIDNDCYMNDLIADCAVDARNHGHFVFCVAHRTIQWKMDKRLSLKNMGTIIRCAARADIP